MLCYDSGAILHPWRSSSGGFALQKTFGTSRVTSFAALSLLTLHAARGGRLRTWTSTRPSLWPQSSRHMSRPIEPRPFRDATFPGSQVFLAELPVSVVPGNPNYKGGRTGPSSHCSGSPQGRSQSSQPISFRTIKLRQQRALNCDPCSWPSVSFRGCNT